MRSTLQNRVLVAIAVALPGVFGAWASAGSHTWKVEEIFSNASGTIQFIELKEVGGLSGEIFMAGHGVRSVATGNLFTFPANLQGDTADAHLLLATSAFAALPGAPTPDYTIPSGFFSTAGDTIQYGTNPPSSLYDTFTFAPGALPTNGKDSITVVNFVNDTFVVGPNTPTNFAGQSGHVDACPSDCDGSNDGVVGIGDFLAVLGQWGMSATSCAQSGSVGIDEFLAVLGAWGSCP